MLATELGRYKCVLAHTHVVHCAEHPFKEAGVNTASTVFLSLYGVKIANQ